MAHEAPHTATPGNILLVGNWRSDVGYAWQMIERFWIAIAQAFPDRRTILCFPKVHAVNPDILAAGIEVEEFDFDFQHPTGLAKFCRKRDISLLYLTDRPYSSMLYPLLRRTGVRKIVLHDHTPGQRSAPSLLKRITKRTNVRMFGADAYIACSNHVLARFDKVCCIEPRRCYLATNGIDISPFSNLNSTIRDELRLSSRTLLVVSCSRVHRYKRITDIVDAAARLSDLDMHFIHIGDGPDFALLQSRIQQQALGDRFTLLGRRHDVPAILSGCDIAVHASDGEGLCLSILEFMASRLPVVLTDEPTVSRIIAPDRTGMTFPHGNVEALADQLRRLAHDQPMRQRLGQAAREEIEAHYRIENTVETVVRVLRQVDS